MYTFSGGVQAFLNRNEWSNLRCVDITDVTIFHANHNRPMPSIVQDFLKSFRGIKIPFSNEYYVEFDAPSSDDYSFFILERDEKNWSGERLWEIGNTNEGRTLYMNSDGIIFMGIDYLYYKLGLSTTQSIENLIRKEPIKLMDFFVAYDETVKILSEIDGITVSNFLDKESVPILRSTNEWTFVSSVDSRCFRRLFNLWRLHHRNKNWQIS